MQGDAQLTHSAMTLALNKSSAADRPTRLYGTMRVEYVEGDGVNAGTVEYSHACRNTKHIVANMKSEKKEN